MCFENSESVLQDFKKMVANNLCSYEWYGNLSYWDRFQSWNHIRVIWWAFTNKYKCLNSDLMNLNV